MLHPVRLIFNGRDRAAQLSILNPTDKAVTYSVSVIPLRKGKNGEWVIPKNTTPEDEKISKMIRYSPRRARIAEKSRQVIKLMLRKPAGLPKGEYRARIILSPVADSMEKNDSDSKEEISVGIQLNTSFPVIIQHNAELAAVEPLNISLEDDVKAPIKKVAKVEYQRKGEFSSFGNVELFYRATKEDDWRKIGGTTGLAIYSPEKRKVSTIRLDNVTAEELKKGMLRLEYRHNNGRQQRKKKPDSVQYFRL